MPIAKGRLQPLVRPTSLGIKLVVILTLVGIAGALSITVLLASVITPSFAKLEDKAIADNVDRTRAALSDYGAKVEGAVRDYGDWNDSYDYMAAPSAKFERDSFSKLAMANLGVQGMAYVTPQGRIVIARWLDAATGTENPALRAAFLRSIALTDLAHVVGGNSSARYYAKLGSTVAAIGVAQIRKSDGSGTARGHVLMARILTPRQLSALLQVNARIAPPIGRNDAVARGASTLAIAVPIMGADRRAVAVASARFSVPRDVSLLGRRMLLLAIAGSTLLLLIVLMVLRRMIASQVLQPLHRVERHMQRVRALGTLGPLDEDGRRDEIGSLGRSFNAMLLQLNDLRGQVEVQSFALGRSESAVAVMHNVRNALNPISTILSQGVAQGPPVDRTTLDRALGELAKDDVPSARRVKLTAFVAAAIEAEAATRAATRAELQVGREAMAHVLEIIGQQQAHAHERPPLENCDVAEIVARNATIARYSDKASIAFSFPAHPCRAMASRVILSQVIGNLFGNAAEAIAATGTGSGTISVTIEPDANGHVVIAIRDDGEGFSSDIGKTLFQRGFSTRAHKSGGLGLHWCANSMTAMDGALRLESEGEGKGAVAILTLKAVEPVVLADAA
ncbi:CHASE4 domain-containing protein [uncultured Sphingomonas sp.]|uniref:CHASE4 domain-containing protein n=1 Tax=uncultured Sphingomonas sp. TaxID=158754 RepID=UPI0035CA130C